MGCLQGCDGSCTGNPGFELKGFFARKFRDPGVEDSFALWYAQQRVQVGMTSLPAFSRRIKSRIILFKNKIQHRVSVQVDIWYLVVHMGAVGYLAISKRSACCSTTTTKEEAAGFLANALAPLFCAFQFLSAGVLYLIACNQQSW
jgi:hypothetical protein